MYNYQPSFSEYITWYLRLPLRRKLKTLRRIVKMSSKKYNTTAKPIIYIYLPKERRQSEAQ